MTAAVDAQLREHLLREDGQEDICLATYSVSQGLSRTTRIVRTVVLPESGERFVHGNAEFTGDYVLRAAAIAADRGEGVVVLHSHPGGRGWQGMSFPDQAAESSYAYLVAALTGKPLMGMTLAGDSSWSARSWADPKNALWAESVRIVGDKLSNSWNDALRLGPPTTASQARTVSAWGEELQASIVRLRVLIVGGGSVGLDVAQRIAASGFIDVGIMDFDSVETVNLDRMIGATRRDVQLGRSKVAVAARLMKEAATARHPNIHAHEMSICEPEGLAVALDYDIIFSCVDRPWPRGILNALAYADLIPVIDGGIDIQPFPDGGMRSATWRTHVLVPGRPCLVCNGQLIASEVAVDRGGSFDDPVYINGTALKEKQGQNVATLSASVSASVLAQFVSLVAAPGGFGVPLPLQYSLSTHELEHLPVTTSPHCRFERNPGEGDGRVALTGPHPKAQQAIAERAKTRRSVRNRVGEALSRLGNWLA